MHSTLYHMPHPWIMPYALLFYPICHLWNHAPWQLCIHFHLMPTSFMTTRTSHPLRQSYDPTSSNLRGFDKSDVWSNSDVLSPLEHRHPWSLMLYSSLVWSSPTPVTHLLQQRTNSESPTITSTPTSAKFDTPVIYYRRDKPYNNNYNKRRGR